MTESTSGKLCIYCQEVVGPTRDHVPPRKFFAKPRPSDLITVPCCHDCNGAYQGDEDYFWLTFLSGPAGASREGSRLWRTEKLSRAYDRDEGLRKAILRSVEVVGLRTPSGVYLPRKELAMRYDENRIHRVVEKVVRGLYYFEVGRPLPPAFRMVSKRISIPMISQLTTLDPDIHGGRRAWPGTFDYGYNLMSSDTTKFVWLTVFYATDVFVSVTPL